jgi:hypothetical protein
MEIHVIYRQLIAGYCHLGQESLLSDDDQQDKSDDPGETSLLPRTKGPVFPYLVLNGIHSLKVKEMNIVPNKRKQGFHLTARSHI